MKAKALRYGVRMDRHGRDGRPLRAATGRMADGRDRQLHHAFRVVHTYLPGGIGGFLSMCSAVAGRNSDYGRGQHFALDRLMLTDNDCLPGPTSVLPSLGLLQGPFRWARRQKMFGAIRLPVANTVQSRLERRS